MIEVRTGRDGARVYRARVYHRGRYVASRTFARKRDAQEWERRQVDGLRSGVWSDPGAAERPVQDWCDAWLAAQPPRAPATERKIREAINKRIAKTLVGPRRYPFDRLRLGLSVPAMCRAPRGSSDQCRSLCRRCGSCRLLCPAPGPDDHGLSRACKPS